MSEENGVRWLCHRCIRKENVEAEADPVLLKVCDGCQVENWTRLVRGPVVVEEVVVEAETVEEEPVEVVEPEDPYQGMTKEELKAELAKRG